MIKIFFYLLKEFFFSFERKEGNDGTLYDFNVDLVLYNELVSGGKYSSVKGDDDFERES